MNSSERLFSLALIQALLGLLLLAGEYIYLAYHLEAPAVPVVFFSEIIFLPLSGSPWPGGYAVLRPPSRVNLGSIS